MATKRINALTVTATAPAGDDYLALDGAANATRRILASAFALAAHGHVIADVTGLQTALDGKAASAHTHAIADVTNLQSTLDGKAASAHTHAIVDVTGLQAALDGKAASAHTHAIVDVTGLQAALDGKAASAHTHAAADIVSGTLDSARLPNTAVTPGSYTLTALTVDATGRITAASSATAINNLPIGNTTPSTGAFTTLSSSSTTTLNGTTIPASSTLLTSGGALGTPSSGTLTNATGLPVSTGISGLGTGVATALAVNVGSAGALVTNGGALGTPSSGTVTNLTGTASININGTVGATTPSTGAFTTLSSSSTTTLNGTTIPASSTLLTSGGALGTPSSGTVTNLTGTASININGTVGATTPSTGAFTTLGATGDITTGGLFVQRKTSFTPTAVGWYRICAGGGDMAGRVSITGAWDGGKTGFTFEYAIRGYVQGGCINLVRPSLVNGSGLIQRARISSDGGGNVYLDVYVGTATAPGVCTVYAEGPYQPALVASPVVGAVAGSTDVRILQVDTADTAVCSTGTLALGRDTSVAAGLYMHEDSSGNGVIGSISVGKSIWLSSYYGTNTIRLGNYNNDDTWAFLTSSAAGRMQLNGDFRIRSSTTGAIRWANNDSSTFALVQYDDSTGKLTLGTPSGRGYDVDLIVNGNITASASIGKFKLASAVDLQLGNAYVAGAPTATGYVVIKDSTGTSYKIPAVAL